jgi:hypothetical protein
MPATMTHQMFAIDVIKQSKSPLLKRYESILMLATQGPDPFFFYGMLPWKTPKDKNRIQGIGSFLHQHNPNKHLHMLLDKAKSSQNELNIAYALGAIMHYILDKHVHPYVFSKSGFDASGKLTKPYNIYHSYMETLMDVALSKEIGMSHIQLHPYKNIRIHKRDLKQIDTLYAETYKDLCQKNDYFKATQDMQRIYHIVYDRFGIKRKLLKVFLGKHTHPFAVSHPKHLIHEEAKDVLNLSNLPWRHPESGNESTESVLDLFQHALSEMLHIIDKFQGGTLDHSYHFGDISYDGMNAHQTMKYQTMMFPLEV